MSPSTPPRTPTVAIARILRGLGLVQGDDFRVTGDYRNGERIGTFVLALSRHADETIAAHADEIERLADEGPFAFRVSVRYPSGDRPMTGVANYGSRVREEPPAPAEPTAPEPAPEPEAVQPEPESAPELPPAGSVASKFLEGARERAWGRQRARALGWSTAQADLMAAAAAIQLQYRQDGVLRYFPQPGYAGHPVAEGRLTPLVNAGLLVISEPFGPGYKRVSVTADGREALHLWRVYRPTPAMKGPRMDREALHPLLGGELATSQNAAADEQSRHRLAHREAMYAAMDELHAWEARDERLWNVWARVQDITHRLGRSRPIGWIPTDEEIETHRIDPGLVAELRAEAGRPTPKPQLPTTPALPPRELPPLTVAPDDVEQLDLFAAAS
ncbi:hypothetical protein [Streptomyces sp. A1136]|uniref:hypothetical protein n=1 Tax=Streptomyces sp. A1136 TaxID=2563102 RepID=UPI0019CF96E6|nr:hypothetical protein [Streptomyces sp. A1136]